MTTPHRPTLTITHTAADGTMLKGTRKGDGAWDAIKAAQAAYTIRGWKYFPSIRAIGVSHSRDRAPSLGNIDVTAEVLRAAGFDVEIDVEATPRPMEEAEADRAERMDDRADALHGKAERRSAESAARWAAAQEIAEGIPSGQPILVGHHSERGHRRDLARMDTNQRKSIELEKEAEHAAHGAVSAEKHMTNREDPRRTMRRIETLEADRRRVQRGLDGHTRNFLNNAGELYDQHVTPPATGRYREQMELQAADLDEKIRYWKKILQEAIDSGRFNPLDLIKVKKGDEIAYWGGWSEVVRVNRKTVTVKAISGGREFGQRKVTVDEIRGHRAKQTVDAVDLDATVAVTE